MSVSPLIHASNVPTIRKILTWTAPALAIPALRYTQDNQEQRKELFVRDASTYSIGALLFLSTEFISKKILNRFNIIQNLGNRDLTAFLIALTANLLYAGIGAVRFSQKFSQYQAQKREPNSNTVKPFPNPSIDYRQVSSTYRGTASLKTPISIGPTQKLNIWPNSWNDNPLFGTSPYPYGAGLPVVHTAGSPT